MNKMVFQSSIREIGWVNICLLMVLISMPWYNNFNSYALVIFSVVATFTGSWREKKKRLATNYLWLLPVMYFVIVAASMAWDPNGFGAFKSVETNAGFLILPPLIASLEPLKKHILKAGLLSFAFSTCVVCLVCLVLAWSEYRSVGDYRVFYYQYLSGQLDMNAIYLSLYIALSICIFLYYYFIRKNTSSRFSLFLILIICAFLCFVVMLLSSKMILFLLCLLIIFTALYISYSRNFLWQGLVILILFIAGAGFAVWQMPYVKWRVQVTLLKDYKNQDDNQNGLAVRAKIWQHAADVIGEKPVTGFGIKGGNDKLVEKYREEGFWFAEQNGYNCHNMYLQLLVNTGMIGLIPILVLSVLCAITSAKRRSYLFMSFMVLFLGLSVTESLLEVQKGIVFAVIFIFLFYYHPPETTEKTQDSGRKSLKSQPGVRIE